MPLKIALIGNPNSGKTTLFNILTGANQTSGTGRESPWKKSKAGLSVTGLFLFAIFPEYTRSPRIPQRKI